MLSSSMDAFEAGDGGWTPSRLGWLSPRISFSQDIGLFDSLKISPEKRKRETASKEGEDPDSASEFEFAQSGRRMDVRHEEDDEEEEGGMLSADELFAEGKLRPLVKEWWAGEMAMEERMMMMGGRSFNENPRCASMAMENARRQPARSCVSLSNSRCSSPKRAVCRSSPPRSKQSMRFKDFFKLKKKMGKELPSIGQEFPSIGKEFPAVGKQVPATSKQVPAIEICKESTCKSPRSFWPFSRSNSAGESKSAPAISPPPRRSNSAGESKTSRRTIPPINPSIQTPQIPPIASSKPLPRASVLPPDRRPASLAPADTIASKLHRPLWDFDLDSNPSSKDLRTIPDPTVRAKVCQSPGRPLRRVPANPARNFARGSPGRRGVWNSPGRANGGRGSIRMDGGPKAPKVLVRPQDMRNRESWKGSDRPIASTMRVTPVLNVPVYIGPSLRGNRASSKSKIFSLGKLFSKKERDYAVLPPRDSQSGA